MTYFVRIDDPTAARRRMLESSKDVIRILKGYHALLAVRDQKKEAVDRLRQTLAELSLLIDKVEKMLPETSLKEVEGFLPKHERAKPAAKRREKPAKHEKAEPVEKETAQAAAKPVQKKSTELERLEGALANIEERLSRL